MSVEFRVSRLGENFRKQERPACSCCGYDAEWILSVASFERLFCERDLLNAFLDAMNFNVRTPAAYDAPDVLDEPAC